MKRALDSFAFGVLCSLMLLALSLVTSSYALSCRPWFGLDCANADSIADKMTCGGLWLVISGLIFLWGSFAFVALRRRLRQGRQSDYVGRNGTLGLD
jgi:hypothetical protein